MTCKNTILKVWTKKENNDELTSGNTLMQKFKLENANGYVVFKVNGKNVLVDTGSPITFAVKKGENVEICGEKCEPSVGVMAAIAQTSGKVPDFSKLTEHMGKELSLLLGNDVLSKYKILIDVPKGEIAFDTDDIAFDGSEIKLEHTNGYFLVRVNVNGIKNKAILDTGVLMSYLSDRCLNGCFVTRTFDDYSPIYGNIHSDVFQVPVTFGGKKFDLDCGKMPDLLLFQASVVNAGGVIGSRVIRDLRMLVDIENGVIKIA